MHWRVFFRGEHLAETIMKTKTWFKDVLLITIGLSSLVALTALLMASDRIGSPVSFRPMGKPQLEIESTAKKIDATLQRARDDDAVQAADRADDLSSARRLALSLAGTIPSVEEIRAIEKVEPEYESTGTFHVCSKTNGPAITWPSVSHGNSLVSKMVRLSYFVDGSLSVGLPSRSTPIGLMMNWPASF